MLIRFFRSSFLIQYIVLLFIAGGIWAPAFLNRPAIPAGTGLITPLYEVIFTGISRIEFLGPVFALIIIIISSFSLNNILIYHELAPKNNILPSFIFILLTGSNPLTLTIYPVMIVIPFFIWLLHTLYRINDEPENFMLIFNAGMLISVISMIYVPAAIFILCLWLILAVYGTLNSRNLVISLLSFGLPYIYLFLYFFWTDEVPEAAKAYLIYLGDIFSFRMNKDIRQILIWALFAVLMLLPAFLRISGTIGSFSISFRKKMSATLWILFFTLPMILFIGKVDYNSLILVPASIMITHYYNHFKKSVMNEIALLILLLAILANNYLFAFNA